MNGHAEMLTAGVVLGGNRVEIAVSPPCGTGIVLNAWRRRRDEDGTTLERIEKAPFYSLWFSVTAGGLRRTLGGGALTSDWGGLGGSSHRASSARPCA